MTAQTTTTRADFDPHPANGRLALAIELMMIRHGAAVAATTRAAAFSDADELRRCYRREDRLRLVIRRLVSALERR